MIAFSKAGVWGVVFVASGQPMLDADGPIYQPPVLPVGTVSAVVYGLDGGRRDLGERPVGQGWPRVIRGQTNPTIGSGEVWVDGCTFTGTPQTGSTSALYMTGCTVTNAVRGVGPTANCVLVRDCTFSGLKDDAAQNPQVVIRVTVTDIAGSQGGNHADGAQLWGSGIANRIFYRLSVRGDAQGWFCKSYDGIDGLAIVDCDIDLSPTWGCGNGLEGPIRHAVITDNRLVGYSRGPGNGGDIYIGRSATGAWPNKTYYGGWSDVRFAGNTIGTHSIDAGMVYERCAFEGNTWGGTTKDGLP